MLWLLVVLVAAGCMPPPPPPAPFEQAARTPEHAGEVFVNSRDGGQWNRDARTSPPVGLGLIHGEDPDAVPDFEQRILLDETGRQAADWMWVTWGGATLENLKSVEWDGDCPVRITLESARRRRFDGALLEYELLEQDTWCDELGYPTEVFLHHEGDLMSGVPPGDVTVFFENDYDGDWLVSSTQVDWDGVPVDAELEYSSGVWGLDP